MCNKGNTMQVLTVESTPNPNALKFTVNARLLASGSRSFDKPEAAGDDELAKKLFGLDGVTSVFYMERFVTVSKNNEVSWSDLEPVIRETLEVTEEPKLLEELAPTGGAAPGTVGSAELLSRINEVLDDSVRPALAGDGGGLEIVGLEGYNLTIFYQGACGTCPSSIAGTLGAIENLLRMSVDPRITVKSSNQEISETV